MMRLLLVATLSLCILTGCMGRQAKWSMVGGPQVLESEPIEVNWPKAWMRFMPAERDDNAKKEGLLCVVTRDGIGLQAITLKKRPIENGFTNTRKKVAPGLSPQELSDLVVDDMRANPNFTDLQVVENSPATLDGISGYKVVVRYRAKTGLPKQAVYYGCLNNGSLYFLIYDAPQRHYSALDLPTFDEVKKSLKWKTQVGEQS